MAFEARIHFATSMANELEELKVHEFRIRRSVLYLLARGAFLWIVGLFVVLGFDRVLLQAASENSWSVGSLVFDFDAIINFSLWSHVVLFTLYGGTFFICRPALVLRILPHTARFYICT